MPDWKFLNKLENERYDTYLAIKPIPVQSAPEPRALPDGDRKAQGTPAMLGDNRKPDNQRNSMDHTSLILPFLACLFCTVFGFLVGCLTFMVRR